MNLQENIARMEKELADMKKQLEQQDKLELKGGEGYAIWTRNHITPTDTKNDNLLLTRGAFRATKELAEIADRNMVARNKLEAYVMQLEPNWRDLGIPYKAYSIQFDTHHKYSIRENISFRHLSTVYMPKETAEILCEALNNSEIEL